MARHHAGCSATGETMDIYEKQLLETLRSLGGGGTESEIVRTAYFPNASLATSAQAVLDSGLAEASEYIGNNPSSGWAAVVLTPAGWSVLDSQQTEYSR